MPNWNEIKTNIGGKKESGLDWGQIKAPPSAADVEAPIPFQDAARIASVVPTTDVVEPAYSNFATKMAVVAATPYAKVIESPGSHAVAGALGLVSKYLKVSEDIIPWKMKEGAVSKATNWLDKMAKFYDNPEENLFLSSSVARGRATVRAEAKQEGTGSLILNDLGAATTDLAGLLAQFSIMRKVSPITANSPMAALGQHLTRLGVHGFITSPGTLAERAASTVTRIGYNITPYLANATGATGMVAFATDAALNMFLTSPTYKRIYDEAGGINKQFMIMALPQFVMDVGMAMSTRGLPENIMGARIRRYNKGRIKALKMPDGEVVDLIMGIQEKLDLGTGKPNVETVKRIVKKTISKYPQKVTDLASLTEIGNKIAKDMGIEHSITWKYTKLKGRLGYSGRHIRRNYTKLGGKTYQIPSTTITIRIGETGKHTEGVRGKLKTTLYSASQGNVKELIVHELVHALPEMIKQRVRGLMHPPNRKAFDARVKEERTKVFFRTEDMTIFEDAELREGVVGTKNAVESGIKESRVDITKDPPKPPESKDDSPGVSPDGGKPTRWGLSDPSVVRDMANKLYSVIDVEARYKAVGAPETGRHVKNYFSMRSTLETLIHKIVKHLTVSTKLTTKEFAAVTYYASQPGLMKDIDAKKYPVFVEAVKQVNEAFLRVEKMLKKVGIIIDPWPQTQITRLQEDIVHYKQMIENIKISNEPIGFKRFRLEKINKDMIEAEGAIKFLKEEDIQYVHIPTRLWLGKLMKDDPTRARTIMNEYYKERKTIDIRELATKLKKMGVITDEDIDIRNILAAYYQQAGHKIAIANIIKAATKEGLIVDGDVRKDWPMFNPRYAPSLKGKRINPAFERFVDEFTSKSASVPLHRVMAYFKMTQFDSPLFMPFYDLYQAFWLGSLRSIKTPINAWKAFKSMKDKDMDFIKLSENGIFSRPFTAPFESFMKSIDIAKQGNNFVGQAISFLKGEWQGVKNAHPLVKPWKIAAIPIDAIYKPIWHMSWGGDQLIRLLSGHHLLSKGYSHREAAQIAAKFHADYASVPPKLKNVLNKVFFTPIFPIVMGKLQTEMIYQTGVMLKQAVQMKKPEKKTKAMVSGLMGLIGLSILQNNILKQLGYDEDTFGYRYTKQVVDEDGNMKELVISTPNPGNVLLRYAKSFRGWPHTPEEFGRYITRLSWRLQPVWRLAVRLSSNLEDDGKTPIYNPWGDPEVIAQQIISYSAGSLVKIIDRVDALSEGPTDRKAAWEALKDDVGDIWTLFLKPTVQVYLRESKSVRDVRKMNGMARNFDDFLLKKPFESDEAAQRAMYRFERALRAIKEEK